MSISFNNPCVAADMSSFDSQYATPGHSTMSNNIGQTQRYIDSSTNARTNTRRVSKAMKGKRVHACERPGCTKVSYPRRLVDESSRSSTLRRFSPERNIVGDTNSVMSRKSNIIARRHAASAAKDTRIYAKSDTSSRRSSLEQQAQSQPIITSSVQFEPATTNDYYEVWGSMDSSISYSHCSSGQSQSSASIDDHSSPYSYTNEICNSPIPGDSFTSPQYPTSGMPVEMVTAIDEYLRSILKPEAFSSSHSQMNPTIWSPELDIDPTLTKTESPDQLPLYSWPPNYSLQYDNAPQMIHPSSNQ
ncbi:hypothetical protein N7457_004725 [Penicillium paradoxum]|uniref:uncharacterized protein n=1 Tax=Penicillium paradoxum TaxID=176176 RepID=UPI0025491EA6|nr:uncharacterized protein N7457_004725 [Penicillium paradoxum]KAJ5782951.1 hypothetical protein N7457_004725 [Penicillium paradoxum]